LAAAEQEQQAPATTPAEGAEGESVTAALPDGELLDTMVVQWLPENWQGGLDLLAQYPLLMLPLVIIFGYLAGKLLQLVLTQVFGRITKHTAGDWDDRLLVLGKRPALTTPVILSLSLFTAVVPMPGMVRGITVGVLATILLFSWLRALLKASHLFLEMLAARKNHSDFIQPRTMPLFEITFKIVLVALAVYLLLLIWGVDPTAWLASAGIIGIAVGFAARDTLANLFSGIFIVADAPYKIGDYVVLDTGERGEVTHLGIRSTRLLTRDDVEITIPNAIIGNAKIINESGGPWEKHRIRLPVGVAYGSNPHQVIEVLEAAAAANKDVISYPEPRVRMRGFGESALNFELLCWIEKPVQRGLVLHELLLDVYDRFNAAGIRIPFPQRDVHMIEKPPPAPPADS
jgi:small-conductance mechanosensitive channel